MTTVTTTAADTRPTTKQKVGFVLCGLYGLGNIPSVVTGPPEGEVGPPFGILVLGSICGAVSLVGAILAWRGNRVALRLAAGAMILSTLTGLPAFFVDVPMFVKALVAVSVVLTVITVVLMFSTRRPAPVVD